MAITHIVSGSGSGTNGGSSTFLDTTGANLLVVSLGWGNFGGTPVVTDNKGNTWTLATQQNSPAGVNARLYYATNPTAGAFHQFSVTGSTIYASFVVHAFAGADLTAPLDTPINGANKNGTGPLATGSITPSVDGALIVSGFGHNQADASLAVDSGLTLSNVPSAAGSWMGAAMGWKVQTTAGAINPSWSWSGSSEAAAVVVAFKPAAAAERIESIIWMPV